MNEKDLRRPKTISEVDPRMGVSRKNATTQNAQRGGDLASVSGGQATGMAGQTGTRTGIASNMNTKAFKPATTGINLGADIPKSAPTKTAMADPRMGGMSMGQGPKSAPTVSTKPATTGINLGADIPKSKPAPTKMAASGQGGYGQGKVTAPPTQTAKAPAANPFNVAAGGVGKMDGSNLAKPATAQAKAPAANPFNVSAGMVANMGGGSAPKAAPAKQTAGINLGADIPQNAPAVATQPAPKKQFKKSVAFGQAAESKQLNDILRLSGLEPKEAVNEGILSDMAAKSEMDHEIQMARGQLYKCAKYSIELHNMLKGISEEQGLEAWVQAKITKASDYLGAVKHYLEYEMLSNGEMPVEAVEPEVETEVDLDETTTAGGIAAVAQPLGDMKKRR